MKTSESRVPARSCSFVEDGRRFWRFPPPATLALLLVTVAAFIGQALRGMSDWTWAVGLIPANVTDASSILRIVEGQRVPACLTLFSYMFLHANLFHLLTNMAALWMFGVLAEPVMGTKRFAATYLSFGVITGITIVALVPHWALPMVGASGAISGITGAFLALRYSEWARNRRPTKLLLMIEAVPLLALMAWLVIRHVPPEPDRELAAAWHLIPFMIAWYGVRIANHFSLQFPGSGGRAA